MKHMKGFLNHPATRTVLTTVLPFLWFLGLDLGFRWLYTIAICPPWNNAPALIFSLCWSGILAAFLALLLAEFLLAREPLAYRGGKGKGGKKRGH